MIQESPAAPPGANAHNKIEGPATKLPRHCEERSDVAIPWSIGHARKSTGLPRPYGLAMTEEVESWSSCCYTGGPLSRSAGGRCRPPYGASFRKIGFAKYDFLLLTGIWVTQTCRRHALFGQYVEILLKNPLRILDFCANSCIMECRLKMGGVYIGRTDRRAVR